MTVLARARAYGPLLDQFIKFPVTCSRLASILEIDVSTGFGEKKRGIPDAWRKHRRMPVALGVWDARGSRRLGELSSFPVPDLVDHSLIFTKLTWMLSAHLINLKPSERAEEKQPIPQITLKGTSRLRKVKLFLPKPTLHSKLHPSPLSL